MVQKYIQNCELFKVAHKRENTLEYWRHIEGIDQPVIKKRH